MEKARYCESIVEVKTTRTNDKINKLPRCFVGILRQNGNMQIATTPNLRTDRKIGLTVNNAPLVTI